MNALALLLLIGLLVYFWLASLKSRDIATQTARGSCRQQGLQLLDGTVALGNIRPYYTSSADFGLRRTYVFDYSGDGISRQTGCVIMHNFRVMTVVLGESPSL